MAGRQSSEIESRPTTSVSTNDKPDVSKVQNNVISTTSTSSTNTRSTSTNTRRIRKRDKIHQFLTSSRRPSSSAYPHRRTLGSTSSHSTASTCTSTSTLGTLARDDSLSLSSCMTLALHLDQENDDDIEEEEEEEEEGHEQEEKVDRERSKSGKKRRNHPQILHRVAEALKSVQVKDRRWRLSTYRQCFVGSEAVTLLMDLRYANTRNEGVLLGRLANEAFGLFSHVVERDKELEDGEYFYYFLQENRQEEDDNRSVRSSSSTGRGRDKRLVFSKTRRHTDTIISTFSSSCATFGKFSSRSHQTNNSDTPQDRFHEVAGTPFPSLSEQTQRSFSDSQYSRSSLSNWTTAAAKKSSASSLLSPSSTSHSSTTSVTIKQSSPLPTPPPITYKLDAPPTTLQDALNALQTHLQLQTFTYKFFTYQQCFLGTRAVDMLLSTGCADSRSQAVRIGRRLMTSSCGPAVVHVMGMCDFEDDELFYRFPSCTTDTNKAANNTNSYGLMEMLKQEHGPASRLSDEKGAVYGPMSRSERLQLYRELDGSGVWVDGISLSVRPAVKRSQGARRLEEE